MPAGPDARAAATHARRHAGTTGVSALYDLQAVAVWAVFLWPHASGECVAARRRRLQQLCHGFVIVVAALLQKAAELRLQLARSAEEAVRRRHYARSGHADSAAACAVDAAAAALTTALAARWQEAYLGQRDCGGMRGRCGRVRAAPYMVQSRGDSQSTGGEHPATKQPCAVQSSGNKTCVYGVHVQVLPAKLDAAHT
eukprot:360426-Chlamydomonas_euryale.AAC.3